jgi:hypothetical protein
MGSTPRWSALTFLFSVLTDLNPVVRCACQVTKPLLGDTKGINMQQIYEEKLLLENKKLLLENNELQEMLMLSCEILEYSQEFPWSKHYHLYLWWIEKKEKYRKQLFNDMYEYLSRKEFEHYNSETLFRSFIREFEIAKSVLSPYRVDVMKSVAKDVCDTRDKERHVSSVRKTALAKLSQEEREVLGV